MTKYHKAIRWGKINIAIRNKDSFEECNKEILEELERHPDLNDEDKQFLIKEVLN